MTTAQPLSRIERVSLRDVWPNEARDFTPWLAEHIAELGKALGVEIELRDREAPVGDYSLDILATDLNGNRPVIIENQLESTNHDHLGKLLTYAAGFDANIVVWITREFRDEHRQALDWLNQRTNEQTQFFGVVVELWKIDGSRPAPHFRLVATPNDWRKETLTMSPSASLRLPTTRGEQYKAFFQKLFDTLREDHNFTGARKGQPQSYYNFSVGYGWRVTYGVRFAREGRITVEVYIDSQDIDWNIRLFHALQQSKGEIEDELQESLEWDHVENRKACRIAATRPGSIDNDDDALAEIHDWMVDHLLRFKTVFDPRLKELVG